MLALARKMMDGRTKQDILDSSYHRYAFHDTGVPKWFYEDEKRHMRCASSPLQKPLGHQCNVKPLWGSELLRWMPSGAVLAEIMSSYASLFTTSDLPGRSGST